MGKTGTGDYNSDREGHVKHEYLVINAQEKPAKGVTLDKQKKFEFNQDGYFKIPDDPGLASEIRKEVGKTATVTRVRKPDSADQGHKYHFGSWPEMPWKRKKTDGKESDTQEESQEGQQETVPECDSRPSWKHELVEAQDATQERQVPQDNQQQHSRVEKETP